MNGQPLRFVQASDLHLEQPAFGLNDIPEFLRPTLIDAPYRAAIQVFDAALHEAVDFLVLAGDVVQVDQAGPRAVAFLLQQFNRLADAGIHVYWAGGKVDAPESWPETVVLPANVQRFTAGRIEEIVHERHGLPLVRIVGSSRATRGDVPVRSFPADAQGLFTIGIAHGTVDAAAAAQQKAHYFALGGAHARRTLGSSPHTAHYAGTHQGRSPKESGARGCTLVEVDEERRVRTRLLPTDVLRWHDEAIEIHDDTTRASLEAQLRQRVTLLAENAAGRDLLVGWTISGHGPLLDTLRRGGLDTELLSWLRTEFVGHSPFVWSTTLTALPPAAMPAPWYEQETILGDYLRLARQFQADAALPLELEPYMAECHLAGAIGSAAALDDKGARSRVLRQAVALGADLLSGQTE